MANRNFIQHAAAFHTKQVSRVRFRVGSGAGTFLLQRLLSFTSPLRQQHATGHSAVTLAFSRTPPRHPLAIAATVAALIVAGMLFWDHATISPSACTARAPLATEADTQIDNADNDNKDTRRLYIGINNPRPNTSGETPVSRRRRKTQVPTETPTRKFTTEFTNTLSKPVDWMSPHTHALAQVRAYEGNVLELTVNRYSVTWLLITSMLYMMQSAARGGDTRGMGIVPDPPSYDPALERTQPFKLWTQKLMIWSIYLATDMDQGQQATAIISQLRGKAALMAQNMSEQWQQLLQQQHPGITQDPVNYLLHSIAQAFAPPEDETLWGDRMQAIRELESFHHERNESVGMFLDRFNIARWEATMGNADRQLSREACISLILRVIGITHQDLRQVLRPMQGRLPETETEFQTMCSTLRQWYHLRKNAPQHPVYAKRSDNRGKALHQGPRPDGMIYVLSPQGYDPWSTADPWGGGAHSLRQSQLTTQAAPQQASPVMQGMWINYDQAAAAAAAASTAASTNLAAEPPQANTAYNTMPEWGQEAESVADTDSNTESSLGEEINYSTPEFAGLTHPQISEKLWWNMTRAKSMWRKHMQKPVRKARRFFKKAFPQIRQPKGKGKARYNAMTQMSDQRHDQIYFGGKGKSKGKRQTTGKGFGRRSNPTGPDGETLKCTACNSTEHFRAVCPEYQSSSSSPLGLVNPNYVTTSTQMTPTCPLADILYYNQVETAAFSIEEQNDLRDNHDPWPSMFYVPERLPDLPYTSFLREPQAEQANKEIQDAILAGQTYPKGRTHELNGELLTRANVLQSVTAPQHARTQVTPAQRPETTHLEQFPSLHAFGDLREQYLAKREERRAAFRGRNQEANPGIQEDLPDIGLPNYYHSIIVNDNTEYPVNPFLMPPQAVEPIDVPVPQDAPIVAELLAITLRRTSAVRQLAAQMSSSQGLGDPAHNVMRELTHTAHEIHRIRAAEAVAAGTMTTTDSWTCVMCLEEYDESDSVSTSRCHHHFHTNCISSWSEHRRSANFPYVDCPRCRDRLQVISVERFAELSLRTEGRPPIDARSQESSATSVTTRSSIFAQHLVVMPTEAGPLTTDPAVRSTIWKATLPNGEQTIIPDTGAFESVTGAKLARVLLKDAVQNGAHASTEKLAEPFIIGGIGGTESCKSRLNIDLAVPTTSGAARSMHWTPPIVEGAGEGMPGLLGLNDLEKNRAIFDIGGKKLIYPGPGEVTYNLPPGSIEMPLKKSPNGAHLCLTVNDYGNAYAAANAKEAVNATAKQSAQRGTPKAATAAAEARVSIKQDLAAKLAAKIHPGFSQAKPRKDGTAKMLTDQIAKFLKNESRGLPHTCRIPHQSTRIIQDTGAVESMMSKSQLRTSIDTWNSILLEPEPDNNAASVTTATAASSSGQQPSQQQQQEPDMFSQKPLPSPERVPSQESLPALETVSDLGLHEQASEDPESGSDSPHSEPGRHEQELSSSDSLPELVKHEKSVTGGEESEDSESSSEISWFENCEHLSTFDPTTRCWKIERRLPVEQPEHTNLDVSSSSVSEGGPETGSLVGTTTKAGRKGESVPMFEGQSASSNPFVADLFTYDGYEAEDRSHDEPSETDLWYNGGVAATWYVTPVVPQTVPKSKTRASLSRSHIPMSWFRTAALIGVAVVTCTAPVNDMWTSHHTGKLHNLHVEGKALKRDNWSVGAGSTSAKPATPHKTVRPVRMQARLVEFSSKKKEESEWNSKQVKHQKDQTRSANQAPTVFQTYLVAPAKPKNWTSPNVLTLRTPPLMSEQWHSTEALAEESPLRDAWHSSQGSSDSHNEETSARNRKSADFTSKVDTIISKEQRKILFTYAQAERVFSNFVKIPFNLFDNKAVISAHTERIGRKELVSFEPIALDEIVENYNSNQRTIAMLKDKKVTCSTPPEVTQSHNQSDHRCHGKDTHGFSLKQSECLLKTLSTPCSRCKDSRKIRHTCNTCYLWEPRGQSRKQPWRSGPLTRPPRPLIQENESRSIRVVSQTTSVDYQESEWTKHGLPCPGGQRLNMLHTRNLAPRRRNARTMTRNPFANSSTHEDQSKLVSFGTARNLTSKDRSDAHANNSVALHSVSIKVYEMHEFSSQATEVWPSLARVVYTFIAAPAPDEVRNVPRSVEPGSSMRAPAQEPVADEADSDDDSSSSEVSKKPDLRFDATAENPWKLLGFDISHEDATRQHPSDVIKAFRRLSRIHHPDKHAGDPEEQERQTEIMKKLLSARQMILVEDVHENGLPRQGSVAQTMREHYADKFLSNPSESKADSLRKHTVQSYLIGRAAIFTGKKLVHAALASAFGHIKRDKNAPSASKQMALIQEGAFLRLNGRPIFEVPPGLTTREAVQQLKKELLESSIHMMIEIKLRNHKRRCKQMEGDPRVGKSKVTVRKLVRKAVPGWKRAAYHRVKVMMPILSQKRAKKQSDLTKLGVPWSADEDWKNYRKSMKQDRPTGLAPMFNLKKDERRKKRYNIRRKIRRQLVHTDQLAAQHNLTPNSIRRKTKGKELLVLKDFTHLKLAPDLAVTRMFHDQRDRISVIEKVLKKLREKTTHNEADIKLFRQQYETMGQLVPQLTLIVMEQVKLHEDATKQSTADLNEAMGITTEATPKKRQTRRGRTGTRENRSEKGASAKAASSSSVAPLSMMEEFSANRQLVRSVAEESTCSSEDDSEDGKWHAIGTKCARCMENGINSPARINAHTGLVLCLPCTQRFFDPDKLDAGCARGRVVVIDANYPPLPQQQTKDPPRHWHEDESSFESDYEPREEISPEALHQAQGLDFEVKDSLLISKADIAALLKSKQESDAKIADRHAHHERVRAKEARAKMMQVAVTKANEQDSEESSIDTDEERTLAENGIDVSKAQEVFAGIQADTSSDEETMPPLLVSAYRPIDDDLNDAKMNPFLPRKPKTNTSVSSVTTPEPVVPVTQVRPYDPETDPWKLDLDYRPDLAAVIAAKEAKPAAESPLEMCQSAISKKRMRLSLSTHCCKQCKQCGARPCTLLIDHDEMMECVCKLAFANIECQRPHHLPKHKKFIDGNFIGTEQDFAKFLYESVGSLLEEDEEQFDNTEPRLMPSVPKLDQNYQEIWPEGFSRQSKDDYREFVAISKQSTASVPELDKWYCEKIKLRDIHKKQLAHMIARKKKKSKKLLVDLANTNLTDQEKVIKFNRVGLNKDYKFEEVAKKIADKVQEILDDERALPRHLSFHLSAHGKRQESVKQAPEGATVPCTNEPCKNVAEYVCHVCKEHSLCQRCYRQNRDEIHKCYRTIRPCWHCRKDAHTKCMEEVEVEKIARDGVNEDPDLRLHCDECLSKPFLPSRPALRWTGQPLQQDWKSAMEEKEVDPAPPVVIAPGKPTSLASGASTRQRIKLPTEPPATGSADAAPQSNARKEPNPKNSSEEKPPARMLKKSSKKNRRDKEKAKSSGGRGVITIGPKLGQTTRTDDPSTDAGYEQFFAPISPTEPFTNESSGSKPRHNRTLVIPSTNVGYERFLRPISPTEPFIDGGSIDGESYEGGSDGEHSPKLDLINAPTSVIPPSAEVLRAARNRVMGIHEVPKEPQWSVAKLAMATAVEAVGPGASQEQQKAVLIQQVGSMLAREYIQFFEKKWRKSQQEKQSHSTCGDKCQYCCFRPCIEAFNHSEETNWQVPCSCQLRQKGLMCEMITDDDAALKAVETGSRNDPNVYGLWLDQEPSPTSEPVDDLQARPSKSSRIIDEPQEVARSSRQEVDANDLGEAAVEEQMEESDMIEVVTSLGATAKAVAPPQPSRRFMFRSIGPSSASTTAKAAAEASAAAAAAAEAASTGSVTARPSQGSRARTHTGWVSELARRSRRD